MSKPTHTPIGESVRWLTNQIEGVANYATKPSADLNAEQLSCILSSLKQAEMLVGQRFSELLSYVSDDGRAA